MVLVCPRILPVLAANAEVIDHRNVVARQQLQTVNSHSRLRIQLQED